MAVLADPTDVGNAPGAGPLRAGGVSYPATPGASDDLPSTKSVAAQKQESALSVVRDLWGGTEAVRDAATVYLPKASGEEPNDYRNRLARSVFHNFFRRTVEGLCGLVFRKDPALGEDVPPQIAGTEDEPGHWENIDLAGTHGAVFAHQLMIDAETAGHAAILVEYPKTPEGVRLTLADEAPLRPYWVPIKKDDIISWRTTVENGRTILTQLVVRECSYEPVGRFSEAKAERFRVFYRDETGVHWQLLAITPSKDVVTIDEGSYPTQDEIPVAEVVTSGSMSMFESAPPLLDLAYLNIAHYQMWSDYNWSIHKTCVPFIFGAGIPEARDINGHPLPLEVGANTAIVSADANASLQYVAHSGESLSSVKGALDDLKSDIGALGLAMLAPQTRQAETAEAKRLDKSTSDSALAVTARGLQDGLERALGFHAKYLGLDDGGSVEVNRDYEGLLMDAPVMQAYAQLVQAGFPSMPVLKALQQGGRIADDENLEELELLWMSGAAAQQAEAAARQAELRQDAGDSVDVERDEGGRVARIGGQVNVERDENGRVIRLVRAS